MSHIGNTIKYLRTQYKISQTELGKKIGVGKTTISNWETGYSSPDTDSFIKLSNIFNCSIDYILGRTNDKLETIKKPDDYSIVIVKAKNANIPAKVLDDYIEFLKSRV